MKWFTAYMHQATTSADFCCQRNVIANKYQLAQIDKSTQMLK